MQNKYNNAQKIIILMFLFLQAETFAQFPIRPSSGAPVVLPNVNVVEALQQRALSGLDRENVTEVVLERRKQKRAPSSSMVPEKRTNVDDHVSVMAVLDEAKIKLSNLPEHVRKLINSKVNVQFTKSIIVLAQEGLLLSINEDVVKKLAERENPIQVVKSLLTLYKYVENSSDLSVEELFLLIDNNFAKSFASVFQGQSQQVSLPSHIYGFLGSTVNEDFVTVVVGMAQLDLLEVLTLEVVQKLLERNKLLEDARAIAQLSKYIRNFSDLSAEELFLLIDNNFAKSFASIFQWQIQQVSLPSHIYEFLRSTVNEDFVTVVVGMSQVGLLEVLTPEVVQKLLERNNLIKDALFIVNLSNYVQNFSDLSVDEMFFLVDSNLIQALDDSPDRIEPIVNLLRMLSLDNVQELARRCANEGDRNLFVQIGGVLSRTDAENDSNFLNNCLIDLFELLVQGSLDMSELNLLVEARLLHTLLHEKRVIALINDDTVRRIYQIINMPEDLPRDRETAVFLIKERQSEVDLTQLNRDDLNEVVAKRSHKLAKFCLLGISPQDLPERELEKSFDEVVVILIKLRNAGIPLRDIDLSNVWAYGYDLFLAQNDAIDSVVELMNPAVVCPELINIILTFPYPGVIRDKIREMNEQNLLSDFSSEGRWGNDEPHNILLNRTRFLLSGQNNQAPRFGENLSSQEVLVELLREALPILQKREADAYDSKLNEWRLNRARKLSMEEEVRRRSREQSIVFPEL